MIKKKTKTKEKNNIHEEKIVLKETLEELKETSEINPDLEEFFDAVNEKKKELEKAKVLPEEIIEEKKPKKRSSFGSKLKTFICIVALLLSFIYLLIYIKEAFNHINYIQEITNAIILFIMLLFAVLAFTGNKKFRNIFGTLTSLLVILMILLNILVNKNIIKLPTLTVMENFKNVALIDAMKWANENNIEINTIYEYSDNIAEGYIISQDVLANTVLKEIKEINITVSDGPNYEKEVILSDMVGLKLDDLLDFIETNHLKNVTIKYEVSEEVEKDIITSQSNKGQIKRSDSISFTISLGSKESLSPIKLEDLVNKSEFDATLYLMQNGITYNLTYDFSETIKNGYVISQDKEKNSEVTPLTDTVNLVISKGKQITVPDFTDKSVDDVINWITENSLKVEFVENYDTKIEKGKLININYKAGDIIAEGTEITINTSKGALTVPNFNSLAEFINWASSNSIKYSQEYQYNDSVSKGSIIKLSIASGTKIDPASDSIIVTISYGSAVTIPNFVGKSKSSITSTCSSIKLNCTFYYTGYSNTAKDVATTQNINAGNKVVSGTYIRIGLSSGPARSFNVYIQAEWIQTSADATISTLRSNLTSTCSDVTFNFVKKAHNSAPSGFIHPDSPVQGGNNTFVQGKTYTIWIVE